MTRIGSRRGASVFRRRAAKQRTARLRASPAYWLSRQPWTSTAGARAAHATLTPLTAYCDDLGAANQRSGNRAGLLRRSERRYLRQRRHLGTMGSRTAGNPGRPGTATTRAGIRELPTI